MLKPKSEVLDADIRQSFFVSIAPPSGHFRENSFDDHYDSIAAVSLSPHVPKEIVSNFENARNVFLYSWFAYEMSAVAEQHVYSTIEYALRIRLDLESQDGTGRRPGLRRLLHMALEKKLISDDGFRDYHARHWQPRDPHKLLPKMMSTPESQRRSRILVEVIPELRNYLAHGASYLNTPGNALATFELARDLINQLFAPRRE